MKKKLADRKANNAYRTLTDYSDLIDFSSNNYLDLDRTGSRTGSRLLSGNNRFIESVEAQIAAFHRSPAALVFSSGYLANLGLVSTVVERHDTVIYDEYIHASLREGIRLSGARNLAFGHNDLDSLSVKIKMARETNGAVFLVTESVFSMDGDSPDLISMADLAKENGIHLIVDEAHALGVLGSRGEGLVCELGLQDDVFARVVTFGKALGKHGAAVLGSHLLRDYLINFCRPFIYTTSPNNTFFEDLKSQYDFLEHEHEPLKRLKENCVYFSDRCTKMRINIEGGKAAIFTLRCAGNDSVRNLAANLRNHGFDIRPIMSPTVAQGQERIRICIHAQNTTGEIDNLINALEKYA